MKKLLLVGVAGVALVAAGAVTANAADLGRPVYKAPPPPPPPPAFSWTGCFAGAHWGWGWGKKDVHESFSEVETEDGFVEFAAATAGGIDTSGAIFGGQIGCDYQFGWGKAAGGPGGWVIGIQADLAGTDINGFVTDPFLAGVEGGVLAFEAAKFGRIAVKQDWLASVTGRLGVTGFGGGFWSQTLWYIRGGVAWTHDKWDLHGASFLFEGADTAVLSPVNQSRTGWTIGAGWEWAFLPNWSAFVEWNHYDFGDKNVVHVSTHGVGNSCGEDDTCTATFDANQRVETVKIGVNYRFNFGKAPVAARY